MKLSSIILFQFLLINWIFSQTIDKNLTEVTTINEQRYYGYILYVTDSLLFLWQSEEAYIPEKIEESVTAFYYSDIKKLKIKRDGYFWPYFLKGALIGTGVSTIILIIPDDEPYANVGKALGIGIVLPASLITSGVLGGLKDKDDFFICRGEIERYNKILPYLSHEAMFTDDIPPELRIIIEQKLKVFISNQAQIREMYVLAQEFQRIGRSNFHISINSGLLISFIDKDIKDAFNTSGFNGRKETPDPEYPSMFNFEIVYNVTDNSQIGIDFDFLRMRTINSESSPIREDADRTSISLNYNFIILPLNTTSINKSEFVIGTGLSYNILYINHHPEVEQFCLDKRVIGGHIRASFDYYILRAFSIQLKTNGRYITSIDVPERTIETYTLKRHQINFSCVDITFGVRFHF